MSKFLAALGLSSALAAATALPLATQAEAAMSYGGQSVADLQHQIAPVEKAQFFFWSGYNWCWYPFGWHGPGWYWCDYEWDNGYGWGGPYGWNGWYIAPYYRSGNGWRWWHHHHHHHDHDHDHDHLGQGPGQPPHPLMGVPQHNWKPLMGVPQHNWKPLMGVPQHNWKPMTGGYAPKMMGGPPSGGGRLCRRPPC
jgi:hypothetical protein